jgi:Lrp/AsnC family leucine-responsive transcriptional regulator
MVEIDEKDKIILLELHKNSRITLTNLAKKANLSIDSVKKRMQNMHENKIYRATCLIGHRYCGFNNVINVMIRLQNITPDKYDKFIDYLKKNNRVTEIFSVSGAWDISITIIAKNAVDQDKVTKDIRLKFGDLIQSWNESLTTKCYKFEEYNSTDFLE